MTSPAIRSTAQRRLAFVAVLLAPALAACGFGAQTDQIYQAAQGVDARSGSIKVLNAAIVASQDGSGTFAGSIVNEAGTAQSLDQVTADGVTATTGADITIAPQTLLNLGTAIEGPKKQAAPLLVLSGSSIKIGRFVRLTFDFSEAGQIVLNVPVVSSDSTLGDEFTTVPLPPGSKAIEPADEPTDAVGEEQAEESAH